MPSARCRTPLSMAAAGGFAFLISILAQPSRRLRVLLPTVKRRGDYPVRTPIMALAALAMLPLGACASDNYGGGYGYDRPGGYNRPPGGRDRDRDRRPPRRHLGDNDQIYRDRDGRYYCKRDDGTTGTIVGALPAACSAMSSLPAAPRRSAPRPGRRRRRPCRPGHRQERHQLRMTKKGRGDHSPRPFLLKPIRLTACRSVPAPP